MNVGRMLAALALGLLLSGCRYNYVPLYTKPPPLRLPTRVFDAVLEREGGDLLLSALVMGEVEAGFMRVQWFADSEKIAEDAAFIDEAERRAAFRLAAPKGGAYRAIIYFAGTVRQVELYEEKP